MEMKERKDQEAKGQQQSRMSTDTIQNIIGAFGKYHYFLCILIFMSKIFVAYHQMAIIFLAPKTSFKCNSTGKEECPCPDPIYDTSVFTSTIVTEWGLICDKKWMASFTQTMFQLGVLIGSVLFGMAADRYGRKKPMLFATIVQIVLGIGVAYIPAFWPFTFARFLIGMAVGGTMVIGFVIVMEFVGSQHRDVLSALYQVPFEIGHLILPAISYFFRDYTQFLLAISVPSVIMLSYFILLPESPRWLLAVKRTDEAISVMERVAKINKRDTRHIKSEVTAFQAALENNQLKKGNILDLFRTPNIRKNMICISMNWLSCGYCFYGVSQFVGQLSGNIFLNVAISAGVTIVGTLASIPMLRIFGRRTIVIFCSYICTICLVLLAFLPQGLSSVILASVGVVSSFIAFVIVYLYTAELFPTVVRNAAMGFSSMIARVGSMIAPFMLDLGDISRMLPPLVFALVPLIAGTIAFLIPETKGCHLMTTIEEGEQFGKKNRSSASQDTQGSVLISEKN